MCQASAVYGKVRKRVGYRLKISMEVGFEYVIYSIYKVFFDQGVFLKILPHSLWTTGKPIPIHGFCSRRMF